MFIYEFVGNKKILLLMDLLTGKARKKIIHFILSVFPSGSLSYNQQKYRIQFHW